MSYLLMRPFLFMMEPERAHDTALQLLELAYRSKALDLWYETRLLPVSCMGIQLPNPVGLAAGLDKNGAYIDALATLGFGFLEIGTVTPKPQLGNDKPRLFRLKQAGAIINRMGFNNDGVDVLVENVKKAKYSGILGINIGKNATTPIEQALDDYIYCLERVYSYASYITINISSPNTQNLRSLQTGIALNRLLHGIKTCHQRLATQYGFYVPLALKIAPDLDAEQLDRIAKTVLAFDIDGLIATNTTLARHGVAHYPNGQETGGLSGRPLAHLSSDIVRHLHDKLAGKVDIIGAGGIDSGDMAVKKMQVGAKAVQLYTGLVYQGIGLIDECIFGLGNYFDALAQI